MLIKIVKIISFKIVKIISFLLLYLASVVVFLFLVKVVWIDPIVKFLNSSDKVVLIRVLQGGGVASTQKVSAGNSFYFSPTSEFGFSIVASDLINGKDVCHDSAVDGNRNDSLSGDAIISCCKSKPDHCDVLEYKRSFFGMKVEYEERGSLKIKDRWWWGK